jgi:hypothetical protein
VDVIDDSFCLEAQHVKEHHLWPLLGINAGDLVLAE